MAVHSALQDLGELVRYQAAVRPERVAMIFEGRQTTDGQLDRRSSRIANGLRAINPAPHMRVASIAKNTDAFYEVLFGAAKARDAMVAVTWRLAPAEIAYIVNDAMAELLLVAEDFFSSVPISVRSSALFARSSWSAAATPNGSPTPTGGIARLAAIHSWRARAATRRSNSIPVAQPASPRALKSRTTTLSRRCRLRVSGTRVQPTM